MSWQGGGGGHVPELREPTRGDYGGTFAWCVRGALPLYQLSYLYPQAYPHLGKTPK